MPRMKGQSLRAPPTEMSRSTNTFAIANGALLPGRSSPDKTPVAKAQLTNGVIDHHNPLSKTEVRLPAVRDQPAVESALMQRG